MGLDKLCCLAAAAMLVLVGAAHSTPAPSGILEGTLKAPVQRGIDIPDEAAITPSPAAQPKYTLVVRTSAGKEVAQCDTDEKGKYRVVLPPGAYVLDLKDARKPRPSAGSLPRPVTVAAGETVRVDIELLADLKILQGR